MNTFLICVIIVLLIVIIFLLFKRPKNILIHNESDIRKGMELQRRKQEYRDYLESYYYDTIPPTSVKDRYREIEKEVLGHYLSD